MSCQARLTAAAERVKEALCVLADPQASVTVERVYTVDWLDPDYWKDNPGLATAFSGRRVYVYGIREVHQGGFTRAEDDNRYVIGVAVLERYTGVESPPPLTWLDERTAWVEANVIDRLADARAQPPVIEGCEPLAVDWAAAYNPDLIRQMNLFRSEVLVTYQAVEDIND